MADDASYTTVPGRSDPYSYMELKQCDYQKGRHLPWLQFRSCLLSLVFG
jgi:hypothetical protein